MSLWADKYKPKTLDQFTYHQELSKHLKRLANSDNVPHMLFYGPSGAGKKTRIAAVLRELYGPGADKLKVEQRQFVTTSNRKLPFTVVSSNFHLEIGTSDLGMYDRVIMQDVLKSIAQTQQIDANARHSFKVVVIDAADDLSRDAQAALRRTMEKYTANMRLILCCNSLSRIIAPVRSRCMLLRVARPETEEVVRALQDVAKNEGFHLPKTLAENIAEHTKRNMRASLLSLESTAVRYPELSTVNQPDHLDWEKAIAGIAENILVEQSAEKLLQIRGQLYDVLIKCIQPSTVLKNLSFELIERVPERLKIRIIEQAAVHEHRLRQGSKAIFHLEAFVVNVMSIYKRHLNNML